MKTEYLQEIWLVKETLAARHGYDVHRMVQHLQKEQAKHGKKLVYPSTKPKRKPAPSKVN